jgi:hypothetical protein
MKGYCQDCKYYYDCICVNADSEFCTTLRSEDGFCYAWEEKEDDE